MLTREENDLLTRVEGSAPMGALMRRYWLPILRTEDVVADGAPQRVLVLGEKLVAFRDINGRVGVMDEACPHRGASLALARNEDCALQCLYHGWRIAHDGTVVETPSEPDDSTFKDRVKHAAYPVYEAGGLVWAYLGAPADEPPVPDFEFTTKRPDQIYTIRVVERCNWAQALEGVLDSAHIGFLHNNLAKRLLAGEKNAYTGGGGLLAQITTDGHPRLHIENTPYGFHYAAVRKAFQSEHEVSYVRTSHFVAPFYGMFAAPQDWGFQQAFVPIDDYHTMFYFAHYRLDDEPMPSDERENIARWAGTEKIAADGGLEYRIENWWRQDRDAMRNGSFSGLAGVQVEDFAVQESMGPIFDRSREHLGTSDAAVIRMRRLMLAAVKAGPMGKSPGLAGGFDHSQIRAAEALIEPGARWQSVGRAGSALAAHQSAVPEQAKA